MQLKVKLLREGAQVPRRAYPTDAGADIFFCPSVEQGGITFIQPGASKVLSTGVKIEVPEGYMLEIKNKSGIASKRQLIVGACVVDSGYDGEIFVNLHNIGSEPQKISPGDKLAQAVLIPVNTCGFVATEENINQDTLRGDGGFGSTGER